MRSKKIAALGAFSLLLHIAGANAAQATICREGRAGPGSIELVRTSGAAKVYPPEGLARNNAPEGQKWFRLAAQFNGRGPGQLGDARDRLKEWRRLPPEERRLIRRRINEFNRIPPKEQERIRREFLWFRRLPVEEQRIIQKNWRAMTPEERQSLRQRLRSVPPGERGRFLRKELGGETPGRK